MEVNFNATDTVSEMISDVFLSFLILPHSGYDSAVKQFWASEREARLQFMYATEGKKRPLYHSFALKKCNTHL